MASPAEKVRKLREESGLSQEVFAQRHLGISSKQLSRIENGAQIGRKAAEALAQYSGIPAAYFMGIEQTILEPVNDASEPLAETLLEDYRKHHGYSDEKIGWIREQLPTYMFSSGTTALTISSSIESLSAEYDRTAGLKLPPPERERASESHDTGRGGIKLAPSKKKR